MDLLAGVFIGRLNESFNEDIQREFPPLVAPRAIAYMTKFAPTMRRIMISNPMAGLSTSMIQPFPLTVGAIHLLDEALKVC
jgi:hypothetical protein